MKNASISFLCLALLFSGCLSFRKETGPVFGVEASTMSGTVMPGTWFLIFEDLDQASFQSIKPSSFACSGPTFSLDARPSIRSAFEQLADQLFERVERLDVAPVGAQNGIVVRLNHFRPQFALTELQISTASVEMAISVTVLQAGQMKKFSVTASRSNMGVSGGFCGNLLDVLAEPIEKASQEIAERAGQRIALITKQ